MEQLPYTDSTGLLAERARLVDRLADEGYLYLRNVLPAAEVARVRHQVLALAAGAGWLRTRTVGTSQPGGAETLQPGGAWTPLPSGAGTPQPTGAALPAVDAEAMARCPEPTRQAVLKAMWRLRDLHALMHSAALLAVVESLLGEPVFVHPRKVLRFVAPERSPVVSGLHQDHPGVQGSPRTLTAWTPLAPVTPETGGLTIVPRSHRDGLLPLRLCAGTIVGWETDLPVDVVHSGPMDPGDVLVFTAYTVHGGSPNTGGLRLSADCRYQPLDEPVCRDSVELDDGDWDEVYRTWPGRGRDDPLAHYWRGLPLVLADYDPRADAAREREAIAAGRRHDPAAASALRVTAEHSADPAIAAEAAALLRSLPDQDHDNDDPRRTSWR